MKRGTASRVFFGVDKTNEDFGGLLLLSQVTLGKKSGMFDEHKGLCIVDNVLLGKGIARVISVIIRGTSPLSLPDAIADSLSYVKAFGGTEQRNLPAEYTQLAYIGSAGTQYINTGITSFKNTNVLKLKIRPLEVSNTRFITFVNPTAGINNIGLFISSGFLYYQYGDVSRLYAPIVADTDYVIEAGNGYLIVNGTSYTGTPVEEFTLANPLYIGTATKAGAVDNRCFYGNIYYYHYEDKDGNLLFDGIPAKDSNNVLGMYDTVSGNFFTNAGTGTFAAGPEAVPTPDTPMGIVSNNGVLKVRHQSGLPLGYTLLDYIKSDKNIPLGFYTNQNSEIEAKWYKDGAGSQYVYQANSGSTLTNNTTAYTSDGGGNWRFGNQTISISVPLNTDIISIQNKGGVWFNNEQQGAYTDVNDFTGDVEFKALGTPSTGVPMLRLSYIKHRQNGVLLGHYVPCVAPDNSIGLYDLIGGVFYTNAEATITAGDPVSDPVEIYADGTVETIEDTIGNTATAETLLKVGNYEDVQSIIDGAITRNVGVKVMTGAETFVYGSNGWLSENTITNNLNAIYTPICTHFAGTDTTPTANSNTVRVYYTSGGVPRVYFGVDKTIYNTAEVFKQYLADQYAAGTPVIILYPLATPTTESVTGQTLQVQAGNNTLEITQASLTGLELEAQYQKRE